MSPPIATFLMFVVNGAVVGTWAASIPAVKADLGASDTEMGVILFCAALGALASQQVTGQLLVRVSSRRVLTASAAVFPLLVVFPLLAPSPAALAAVMVGFGAFNTAMDVSMNAHGVALESGGERSIFSGLHAGWSLGGLIGSVGVAAAIWLGVDATLQVLAAGIALWLLALIASRRLGTGSLRTPDATGIHLPSRTVLPIAALLMLLALVEGGLADWGGIYLRTGIGAGEGFAAFAYAALSLGLLAGRVGGDWAKDRMGSVRLIQQGMLLCAVAIGAFLLLGDPLVALLGMVVAGIGLANTVPQLFAAAGRIPPHGPSLSAAFTFFTIAIMSGPLVIGRASDALGISTALALLVVLSLAVVLLVPRVPRAETNPRYAVLRAVRDRGSTIADLPG